jgi:hypothetical protein
MYLRRAAVCGRGVLATCLWLGVPWAWADSDPVTCALAGMPMEFEALSLLSREPQNGSGQLVAHCKNHSDAIMKLSLSAVGSARPTDPLQAQPTGGPPMVLKVFVDPGFRHPLSTNATAQHAIRHESLIAGNSELTISMPFFVQLSLSRVPASGEYRLPSDMQLIYQAQPVAPLH